MKNIGVAEFCHNNRACRAGTLFSKKYETMRDCYAGLIHGLAGLDGYRWALWVASCEGVLSTPVRRKLAEDIFVDAILLMGGATANLREARVGLQMAACANKPEEALEALVKSWRARMCSGHTTVKNRINPEMDACCSVVEGHPYHTFKALCDVLEEEGGSVSTLTQNMRDMLASIPNPFTDEDQAEPKKEAK